MTPHQPVVSGRRLIKALQTDGWRVVRRRGSHVRLEKFGPWHVLIVPMHREIKKGTLAAILRDAGLSTDDLRRLLNG